MLLALGAGAVLLKGMHNAAGGIGSAANTMVAGAGAPNVEAHIPPESSLAQQHFNGTHAERLLRGQTATQQARDNSHLPRHFYYQQSHTRVPLPVRSTTTVMTSADMTLSDEYKEQIRANIENSIDRETPFRSYRAEHWPDRERRRVPFMNNPNSCFHSSDIKVSAVVAEHQPHMQPQKHVIQNQ